MTAPTLESGIRDNHARGTVAEFLRENLKPGADLDLVTAYFTVFAYDKLKSHLDKLGQIRLLFGEAAFIKNLDPDHTGGAAYVLETGEVPLAFTQAKTVLNLFRGLALGHSEPHAELCRRFDRQIENGANMSQPSQLIASAVQSITSTFQQKLASGLQGRRDFILPLADEQPRDDEAAFELMTWLVVLESTSATP